MGDHWQFHMVQYKLRGGGGSFDPRRKIACSKFFFLLFCVSPFFLRIPVVYD